MESDSPSGWMYKPFSSVILICSINGERLTLWMDVQPFLSVILNQWRATHKLDGCTAILVSDSDLLNQWRVTHPLDGCTAILVSDSDLLNQWRATHRLDGCTAILVSDSDLLNQWRATHNLDVFPIYPVSKFMST